MRVQLLIFTLCITLISIGCTKQDPTYEPTRNQPFELQKISTEGITDQQPSNQAKEFLSNYEEVTNVRAVNTVNDLLVAIEIDHNDRFSLAHIEEQLRKKLAKNFSDMIVTFSTDKKIVLELEKLEIELENENISEKKLKKELKKIINLSKEQT